MPALMPSGGVRMDQSLAAGAIEQLGGFEAGCRDSFAGSVLANLFERGAELAALGPVAGGVASWPGASASWRIWFSALRILGSRERAWGRAACRCRRSRKYSPGNILTQENRLTRRRAVVSFAAPQPEDARPARRLHSCPSRARVLAGGPRVRPRVRRAQAGRRHRACCRDGSRSIRSPTSIPGSPSSCRRFSCGSDRRAHSSSAAPSRSRCDPIGTATIGAATSSSRSPEWPPIW